MLTCITCSKQRTEDEAEEGARGTPSTKEAVKSLTAQVLILQPYFLLLQSHLLILLYILCSSICFLVLSLSLSSFPFLFIWIFFYLLFVIFCYFLLFLGCENRQKIHIQYDAAKVGSYMYFLFMRFYTVYMVFLYGPHWDSFFGCCASLCIFGEDSNWNNHFITFAYKDYGIVLVVF